MEKNPGATTSVIALATNKKNLSHELFVSSETTPMKLQGANIHGLMDRFSTFSSPNIKNLVSTFGMGILDMVHWITSRAKKNCPYDYIQDSVFLGQGFPKVYLFKMSTKAKGVALILLHICSQVEICKEHG